MNPLRIFDFEYLFQANPGGDFLLGYLCLAFFGFLLFVPSMMRKKAAGDKYMKKSIKKRQGRFTAIGAVGLILTLFRFAEVPYFSMRAWLYTLFFLGVITLIITIRNIKKDYRMRLDSVERERR